MKIRLFAFTHFFGTVSRNYARKVKIRNERQELYEEVLSEALCIVIHLRDLTDALRCLKPSYSSLNEKITEAGKEEREISDVLKYIRDQIDSGNEDKEEIKQKLCKVTSMMNRVDKVMYELSEIRDEIRKSDKEMIERCFGLIEQNVRKLVALPKFRFRASSKVSGAIADLVVHFEFQKSQLTEFVDNQTEDGQIEMFKGITHLFDRCSVIEQQIILELRE